MANISVVPTLLKHRVDRFGESQIVVRVYQAGKVIAFEKIKKVNPDHWDIIKREVKKAASNHSLINSLIKQRVSELEERFLQSRLQGVKLTKSKIKNIVKGIDYHKDFIAYCNSRIPERYSKPKQKETRRSYFGEVTKLQEFQKDVSFGDIDTHFLSRYKAWMINERGNSDNTVWKAFKFINTMINDAMPAGIIKDNPFDDFDRGKYTQGKPKFLGINECDKIHVVMNDDIPDRLRMVAAYYLFMCYTGFRFGDAVKFFNYADHVINDERIIITTEKFETEVNILIHDRLRGILNIIKDHPLAMSNKEFNSYTKVLATMAKIDIPFTAHTGRHTFGAQLALLDISRERAQLLLGHKDKRSTEVYYHIVEKSLDKEMRKWDEKSPSVET